jgi:hypothetical protein
MAPCLLLRLPSGRTRVLPVGPEASVAGVLSSLEDAEGLPPSAVRLVCDGTELRSSEQLCCRGSATVEVRLSLAGGGGDGDQPDWTERGKIPSGSKRRGPEARAPDWQADPKKYAEKHERDLRERGELVVAVGPFCVPCGKRFAKQTVYDAHLAGKKHLAALQRMGRTEEAMVCQLDVEAKRRKLVDAEEAKRAATMIAMSTGAEQQAESESVLAARRAEREEKLRQRAMLPMPSCVTATSVYTENAPEGEDEAPAEGAPAPARPAPAAPAAAELSTSELAAAASGASGFSYTSGIQDGTGSARPNRFTTEEMAASHRRMLPGSDWFNVGLPGNDDKPPAQ